MKQGRLLQRIAVNGANIAYQQMGFGPPVILVHGLATNRAFWFAPIARHLARRFQVILFDLRGHGFSDMPNSGYRPADMAADLKGLMDGLGIERAHIIGHSYGGSVALSFAAAYPQRTRTVCAADTLINTLQLGRNTSPVIEISPVETAIMQRVNIDPEKEEHLGIRLLEEFDGQDTVTLPASSFQATDRQTFVPFTGLGGGKRVLLKWKKLIATTSASTDFRAPFHLAESALRTLDVPALLVYGGASRCLSSGEQLQLLLPASRLVVVPGVGHFHPVLRPRVFLSNILRFIRAQQLYEFMQSPRYRRAANTVSL